MKTRISIPDKWTHESVSIPADGKILSGDLDLPAGAQGLVLFAHGSGSSRQSPRNRYVAEILRQAGLGTLLFDLLTPLEETEDAVTGHLRFDIGLLAGRLAQATNWVVHQRELANLGLGYFGSSTGAAAALRASTASNIRVQAIVSRGGRPDLAGGALPYVTAATLLIVGGLDDAVLKLNRHALHQLRCEKYLEVIPDATHLFEEKGALPQVAALAAAWFYEHLRSGK